jgi:hypothetical protein
MLAVGLIELPLLNENLLTEFFNASVYFNLATFKEVPEIF